jgi:hypothetical protein
LPKALSDAAQGYDVGPEPDPITAADIPIPITSKPLPSQLISLAAESQTEDVIRPEVFFVPPPRQGGGSERVGCRVDPAYIAAIARLVESGHFGWTTSSDYIRWAIEAGIQIAMKCLKDENMSNEARVMRAILRRHQVKKRQEQYAQMIDMIVLDIKEMLGSGQEGEAREEFERTLGDIDALNVTSLRDKLKAVLIQEFPELWGEVTGEPVRCAALFLPPTRSLVGSLQSRQLRELLYRCLLPRPPSKTT